VGTFGRHNQAVIEGNPITQAGHDACLATPACSGTSGARNTQSRNNPTHTQYGYANSAGLNDFTSMGLISSISSSNYNSLQLSLNKALSHGLQFQASYTFATRSTTDPALKTPDSEATNGRAYNQYQKSLNYGNSTFDFRHRFVIAPIYEVPFKKGGGTFSPYNLLLSGWQVSGIATFATGAVLTSSAPIRHVELVVDGIVDYTSTLHTSSRRWSRRYAWSNAAPVSKRGDPGDLPAGEKQVIR